MKPLVVALTKGRLTDDAVALFERAGILSGGMKAVLAKKSRRLIFSSDDSDMEFFLAKASDVPTYVDYGAADIGVAGKDTLLEGRRNLYEVLDLGFGACRMVVAGREDMRDSVKRGGALRVATKYPQIAIDYFTRLKQQSVEIVMLNGSVELAPIVGLADVIVDIVETGGTLRENGLAILEEIVPISARLVVNRASMKVEHARVVDLIKKIKSVLREG
ncbi:MAG: ATP phosphoribosyltransferase [Synergistaceae bacterium]|jgi:ATP phosphoribosyltransferase|nr:ATP phosphoribosyltransferase [Synergistaceae bacterium]